MKERDDATGVERNIRRRQDQDLTTDVGTQFYAKSRVKPLPAATMNRATSPRKGGRLMRHAIAPQHLQEGHPDDSQVEDQRTPLQVLDVQSHLLWNR